MKYTIRKFANEIRNLYPGDYDDLSDTELVNLWLKKYPNDSQKVDIKVNHVSKSENDVQTNPKNQFIAIKYIFWGALILIIVIPIVYLSNQNNHSTSNNNGYNTSNINNTTNSQPAGTNLCSRCGGTGKIYGCNNCDRGIMKCRSCNGQKYDYNGSVCLNCRGTGMVKCDVCDGNYETYSKDCDLCEGQKYTIIRTTKCNECDGTQKVLDYNEDGHYHDKDMNEIAKAIENKLGRSFQTYDDLEKIRIDNEKNSVRGKCS